MKGMRMRLIAVAALVAMFFVAAVANAAPSEGATVEPVQRTISATGTGEIAVAGANQATVLNVGVHDQVNGTPEQAVQAVQARVEAIRASLQKLGIPATAIQSQNFNIYPIYGPAPELQKGGPMPPFTQPNIQGYNVDQNLQVEVSSGEQLAKAMTVVVNAGATSVNTFTKGGPEGTPPDAASLAQAVREATEQAKALAQISAEVAGVQLGAVRSINVPSPNPWYGPMPSWRVNVTVTYDIIP